MNHKLIAIKPIAEDKNALPIFDNGSGGLLSIELLADTPINLSVQNKEKRYCRGWYDIDSHQNFPCKDSSAVDPKFDTCFNCRSKTDFNPGFYNSTSVSAKQAVYNLKPHSVYVAYFGNELYKAGILSDSRGMERLYEQGAINYAIVVKAKDAYAAHALEQKLIDQGLRNSVTKSQKQTSYTLLSAFDDASARQSLKNRLNSLGLPDTMEVKSNLDIFFFGHRPTGMIAPMKDAYISGVIKGLVGSYLVVENYERLFGVWLDKMIGYEVNVGRELTRIETEQPIQGSLF